MISILLIEIRRNPHGLNVIYSYFENQGFQRNPDFRFGIKPNHTKSGNKLHKTKLLLPRVEFLKQHQLMHFSHLNYNYSVYSDPVQGLFFNVQYQRTVVLKMDE